MTYAQFSSIIEYMAERAAQNGRISLDPMFAIPEGVTELTHTEGTVESAGEYRGLDETLADDYVSDSYSNDETFEEYDEEPDAPGVLAVLSQTLRTSTSGAQVVDVVIEVEDIVGATNYEVRVTKA